MSDDILSFYVVTIRAISSVAMISCKNNSFRVRSLPRHAKHLQYILTFRLYHMQPVTWKPGQQRMQGIVRVIPKLQILIWCVISNSKYSDVDCFGWKALVYLNAMLHCLARLCKWVLSSWNWPHSHVCAMQRPWFSVSVLFVSYVLFCHGSTNESWSQIFERCKIYNQFFTIGESLTVNHVVGYIFIPERN